jgi:6-phosphogluconolactonase (cycloisomerase 2 family)
MTTRRAPHRYRWRLLGLIAIAVLAGCSGGGGNSGGGTSPGAPEAFARFAYVANYGDSTISIYAINAASGQWRHWGYEWTILVGGINPYAIAVHPSGKFVYVTFDASANVGAYAIDSRGTLAHIGTAVSANGANPQAIAIDPTGRFAYVANRNAAGTTGTVSAFAIDNGTGALTLKQSYPTGGQPHSVAVHPSGKFVYVANFASSDINLFSIEPTTGELTANGSTSVGPNTNPNHLAIDPTGTYAYTANWGTGTVSVFRIDASNGALSELPGSPYETGGPNPSAVAVDPSGTFVYVTNYDFADSGPSVSAFRVGASGALEAVAAGPFATGMNPNYVAVDPSGGFVYVANLNGHTINAYKVDHTTGALTPLADAAPVVTARASPINFAITHGPKPLTVTPKYAYVINATNQGQGSSNVSQYSIAVDGSLGSMTPDSVLAGAGAGSIAVDHLGRFAYVANSADGSVWYYKITGGVLSLQTNNAIGGGANPDSVAVDPSGRTLYVANYGTGAVLTYVITSTGELRLNSEIASGDAHSLRAAVDPSGRYAYVLNDDTVFTVSQYTIFNTVWNLQSTGKLQPMTPPTVPTGGGGHFGTSIAVDPSGRYVYVANDIVNQYTIGPTGALEPMTPPYVVPGTNCFATSVAVDPSGRYVYVTSTGDPPCGFSSPGLMQYEIGPKGELQPIAAPGAISMGFWRFVTVDPSGQFAYGLQNGSRRVWPFAIHAGGTLEQLSSATVDVGQNLSINLDIAIVGGIE